MRGGGLVDGGQGRALLGDGRRRRLGQSKARQLGDEGTKSGCDVAAKFERRLVVGVDVGGDLVEVHDDAGGVGVPQPGVVFDGVVADGEEDVGLVEEDVTRLVAEQPTRPT